MPQHLTVALAQINPTVGDITGNLAQIRAARERAAGADLVVYPELAIVGYPPEDLVLRPAFVDAARAAVERLIADTSGGGPALLLTTPWVEGGALYNAAVLASAGQCHVRFKHDLPNYSVFDEKRVFTPGPLPEPVTLHGIRIGIPICEDIWTPRVVRALADAGAELLVVPNGSPFEVDKAEKRTEIARARVSESGLPLVYVNQVGGQDELVFDGNSFAVNPDGTVVVRLPMWTEAVSTTTWTRSRGGWSATPVSSQAAADRLETVYDALVIGLRDYVRKNRFPGVVLGLSGGIDSALSAAVAVDALSADRVLGVRLPSRYTSPQSQDDAAICASALGIRLQTLSIAGIVAQAEATLAPLFAGRAFDVTEENLQARVRGLLLMATSNKFGLMLLTTGNKSEMSVGYATLYGDMCGGYSVLKDVYKTDVYRLSRWRNTQVSSLGLGPRGRVIPESTNARAPTAELRPGQSDQDSLPPYDVLDAILRGLVEEERSVTAVAAQGHPVDLVRRIQHLLFSAEYKRRQAPPGVKITGRGFGRDRRYPMTNAFRESWEPTAAHRSM
jgi:NAD+ synthase